MRFALFGAGRAGALHARNLAAHPAAELSYVFDIDQAAARRVAAACGGRSPRRQEEIWEAEDVDAVLIASSTDTHVDLLRQAMHAGKPTYCEKPIDLDMEKVRMIAAEATGGDLPICIGFRRRFLPEFQRMRRLLHEGAIGRIESIRMVARDFEPAPLPYLQRSGGLLVDKMIHYFDLAVWLAEAVSDAPLLARDARPTEVYATGSCLIDPAIGQMGDVDTAVVVLRFASGALCTIENGRRAVYGADDRIEVAGATGMLQTSPPHSHQLVHFSQTGIAQSGFPHSYGAVSDAPPLGRGAESFAAALNAFIMAVERGDAVSPSLQDGYRAQLIAEAAVESLRTNRPVAIPSPQWSETPAASGRPTTSHKTENTIQNRGVR